MTWLLKTVLVISIKYSGVTYSGVLYISQNYNVYNYVSITLADNYYIMTEIIVNIQQIQIPVCT